MKFFSHSGMPRNQRFQNTRFQHILEPLSLPISGMPYIFAFHNLREMCITEHQSFLKYPHLGVLEPLLISHSGMAKKRDFRTKNVLQMTFFTHSGMPRNQRFQNLRFQHILEPLSLPISGMAHIPAFQNIRE